MTRAGCAVQGTLQFRAQGDAILFDLKQCAFTNGFVINGQGDYDSARDRFRLRATVSGAQNCKLRYERVGAKSFVRGKCAGSRVRASATMDVPIPANLKNRALPRPAKRMLRAQ